MPGRRGAPCGTRVFRSSLCIRRGGRPKPIEVIVAGSDAGRCLVPPEGGPTDSRPLPAPTRRAGALCGLRQNPGSERFYHRGASDQRIDSRALRPCGRRATVPLTADVNTDDLLPRDLHRSNLDFAVSPPGHPERHPDSRCARATPKGYLHASDDTPAPREAPQRSRHTNRRPIGQRPPAAPPVTDSPP